MAAPLAYLATGFIASLIGGLVNAAGTLAGRVMIALGFGFVSYTGINIMMDAMLDQVKDLLVGMPMMIMQGAGMLNIDTAINMVCSAYMARMVLNGLRGGTLTKFGAK